MTTNMKRLSAGAAIVLVLYAGYSIIYQPHNYRFDMNTRMLSNDSSGSLTSRRISSLTSYQTTPEENPSSNSGVEFEPEPVYNRTDTIPEKTSKLPFLRNFKNPCWRENGSPPRLRCLPYFYLAGPPKCGTSDLFNRMIRHPLISSNVNKELQWIAKVRFNTRNPANKKLSRYLNYFDEAITADIIPSGHGGYHDAILGDFSPSTVWCTSHYSTSSNSEFTSNADVIYHLNPATKILITLRNPVSRTYSDYKHFTRSASPTHFHSMVTRTIKLFNERCRSASNLKHCIETRISKSYLKRMFIGLYYYDIQDFLRVFPKNQIYITKLEERSKDMEAGLQDIFAFLGLEPMSSELSEEIVIQPIKAKDTHNVPGMLNKTRELLEDFFKPYNEKLGDLIGQEYNYNINK